HVADAPVAPPQDSRVAPTPNVHTPTEEKLSQEAVDRLWQVAKALNEPKDAFAKRIRQLMQLPGNQLISKSYLRQTMSIEQYRAAVAYYEGQLKEQVEDDVPDHPPPSGGASSASAGSEPAGQPAAAEPTPAEDPDAEAKAKLRAEVATWALPVAPEEVEYILNHYAPEKARALLWGARRQKPAPPPVEAAAD
ncbi:MAG: hypothetical protein M3361_17640, partial [Candidatus Tectomicrobia bacterium]|nr:hypothetical protein [Candidatus Tectomicrobia bacterium]